MKRVILALVMPLWACAVSAQPDSISLAQMADWPVVCAPDAIPSERYAAEEFHRLFAEATGTTLSLVDTAPAAGPAIYIGPGATGAADVESFGEEGLRIAVAKDSLKIDGSRPRGTLYGVYEFFEEQCGVRYLTHDHTYYPEDIATRPIAIGETRFNPIFAFRWSYYGETNRNPEFAARLHSNTVANDDRIGGRTGFRLVGHNVAYLVPPAEYGESHPEYYALVNGERALQMHGGGPQLCMTNPEVLDVVVQAVLAEIEAHPKARNINVAHMDNEAYCTCENCAAVDAREESHAGATIAFVNAVAERVAEIHPDVLIGTYAYQYTRKPPKTLTVRDNVMIQLCSIEACDYHAIDDPSCSINKEFCDDMTVWQTKAKNIFVWHYNTNFRAYQLPFPNLRAIGPSVDYFSKNNGKGVFMQAAGNGYSSELSDLRNYVMSRCLWKPGRDSWAEAEEFCRLHYAEAAQPILDYLTYYHDLVDENGTHPGCFPTEASLCISPESARKIMGYFDAALALAESDAIRDRVEKASICAYRAALSAASMDLIYADGLCTPNLQGFDPALVDTYAAICAKYEVPMESEHITQEEYLERTRTLFAGLGAVKLEDDTWEVLLLPESNGKVVKMIHKPSRTNVVDAARSFDRFRFEEWVTRGEGPTAEDIQTYTVSDASDESVTLSVTTPDGSVIARTVSLKNGVIHCDTTLTAGADRPYGFIIHPEYSTATTSTAPATFGIYVKAPNWIHANAGWKDARPSGDQADAIKNGLAGGAFAFYNHDAGWGIEQRFDPGAMSAMNHFWSPERRQINLELLSAVGDLPAGGTMSYGYEIRFLEAAPQ